MNTLHIESTGESDLHGRRPWRKQELQRQLLVSGTADLVKDGSTEDLDARANNWPAGLGQT